MCYLQNVHNVDHPVKNKSFEKKKEKIKLIETEIKKAKPELSKPKAFVFLQNNFRNKLELFGKKHYQGC